MISQRGHVLQGFILTKPAKRQLYMLQCSSSIDWQQINGRDIKRTLQTLSMPHPQ